MLTVVYGPKGGQGCSTVTALLALLHAPATIVDLTGDMPALLGMPDPASAGVSDILTSSTPGTSLLPARIPVPGVTGLDLLPQGRIPMKHVERHWDVLAEVLAASPQRVYVDAGVESPIIEQVDHRRLLVTRHCYLSVRRAHWADLPTGIVTVREPGRAITAADIERAVGAPVLATLDYSEALARLVDAGLLAAGRIPHSIDRALRGRVDFPEPAEPS